jgi:hypothetical protein
MANPDNDIYYYALYVFIGLVILAGIYVLSTYGSESILTTLFGKYDSKIVTGEISMATPLIKSESDSSETKFELVDESIANCPNVLIRKGNLLLLINTRRPPEDGTNPVIFNHLDDYIHYVKVQRETNDNYCPVLFLQEESNAQGQNVYRVRPGPFDQQGGTPSPEISIDEIKGVHDFFSNTPGSQGTYVDETLKKHNAGPFNQDIVNTIVQSDIETTGQKYLKKPVAIPHPPNTPPVSDNSKLTRVENISTENAMNLPITPTNETNQIPVYQNFNYSTPPLSLRYKETMTTASENVPITSSVQTITSLPPLVEVPTLPPMTPPSTSPVYQMPLQTQYYNGSLGPYVGSTVEPRSPVVDVSNIDPIVDSSRDNAPYNQGQYPGFDPNGHDQGQYTELDRIHDSTKKEGQFSDNPMDPNWGGVLYTRQQVMSGKYNENQVIKPIYGGAPNVMSIPSLMPDEPPNYIMEKNANCMEMKDMRTRSLRSAPESA